MRPPPALTPCPASSSSAAVPVLVFSLYTKALGPKPGPPQLFSRGCAPGIYCQHILVDSAIRRLDNTTLHHVLGPKRPQENSRSREGCCTRDLSCASIYKECATTVHTAATSSVYLQSRGPILCKINEM